MKYIHIVLDTHIRVCAHIQLMVVFVLASYSHLICAHLCPFVFLQLVELEIRGYQFCLMMFACTSLFLLLVVGLYMLFNGG